MNTLPQLTPFKFLILILLMCLTAAPEVFAQKKSKSSPKGYGSATYSSSSAGEYMKNWLLLGPIPVNEDSTGTLGMEEQEKAFETDLLTKVSVSPKKALPSQNLNGKTLSWNLYTSSDDIVDLDEIYDKIDFASSYALAEVVADSSYTTLLAIGSDDGVKVWLNGDLVHKNWIGRGVTKDQDLFQVNLKKGSNQLLLKVQDINQAWGFSARVLGRAALSEQLITAAERGALDQFDLLVEAGAEVNAKNAAGLSAIHLAQINGRQEVIELLKEHGAKPTPMPSEEAIIDRFYKDLNEKEWPGVAVLVARDGEILYRKGFGYRDVKNKQAISPDTEFRIGSVTKQFTAAAILKLQEEGYLNVNDKLSKYLPNFPRADEVSLHHLLTHTSGIHSYTGKPDFIKKVEKPISPNELIDYFKKDPYDFNPGEEFRYNNSGYFLLGHIIELVSDQTYQEYLKEHFFEPLQMDNTGVHKPGLNLENEALGYNFENGKYDGSINWNMSWAGGAGALYSTLDDLLKWNVALARGKVLNENSLKAAYTPATLNNGEQPQNSKYGYGFGIGSYRGSEVIQHSGGLHGFVSQLAYYPEEKLSVVMLSNATPPQVEFNPNKLAEVYLWKGMEAQKSYKTVDQTVEDLSRYTGRFDFGNSAVMIITSEDDKLFAQLSGQPRFQIFPSGAHEFFWKVVEARIHFIADDEGNIDRAMFYQNGQNIEITRLEEEEIINLDPALFDGYMGKYDYGDEFIISVFKEGDRFFAQGTDQPKFEIFPVSETEFVLKEIKARITFVENEEGKTEKLILHMQGQDKDAPKIE